MKKTETCGINMNSNFRFRILAKSETQNWFKNNRNRLVREVCDPKKWKDRFNLYDPNVHSKIVEKYFQDIIGSKIN